MFEFENKGTRRKNNSEEDKNEGLNFFQSDDPGIEDPNDDKLPSIEHKIAYTDPSAPYLGLLKVHLGAAETGRFLRQRRKK